MTWLVGEERYKWIVEQYRKYRKRDRTGSTFIFAGAPVSLVVGFFLLPFVDLSPSLRQPLQQAVLLLALLFLFASSPISRSARKFLPPPEDRALYFLTPALVSLKAYVTNWNEDDRRGTLKNLTKVSSVVDIWDTGNLRFVKNSVGAIVSEFKKNFQGRVVPAIKKGDKQKATLLQMWLSEVQNTLEMGNLTDGYLKGWNAYLTTRQNSQDPASPEQFPYHPPRPGLLKRLSSRRLDLVFIISAVVAPAIIYYLAVSVPLASRDTAFSGSIGMFGIVVTAYVAYLRLGKQKGAT